MTLAADRIRRKLAAVAAQDPECRRFGAGVHGYRLQPALDERQVAAAEAQYGIRFPDEYRTFLLEVGAGGGGPGYGLFPLIGDGERWVWEGDGAVSPSRRRTSGGPRPSRPCTGT